MFPYMVKLPRFPRRMRNRWRMFPGYGLLLVHASSPALSRQLLRWTLRRSNLKGFFFRTFLQNKKGARTGRQSTARVIGQSSSSTPGPYGDVDSWVGPAGGLWQRFYGQEYDEYRDVHSACDASWLAHGYSLEPQGLPRAHDVVSVWSTMWLRCVRFAPPIVVKRLGAYLGIAGWITCP